MIDGESTIEAAGIRQNPDGRSAELKRLPAPRNFALIENREAGLLAEESDVARRVEFYLAFESGPPCDEIAAAKIARAHCGPFHRGGKAAAVLEQSASVFRQHFLRRESSKMKDAPEAIATAGEMMAERGGAHSGINPTENHIEAGRENIGQTLRDFSFASERVIHRAFFILSQLAATAGPAPHEAD